MARHFRRLILWLLAGIATLALLALCALAAIWWFIDPDAFRPQIQARASAAIGRPVHLTGKLRWQLGSRVFIASDGGDVANGPGFGADPLVRWSQLRLGVALRPLLHKQVLIDQVEVDGLQLRLERNAQGEANWEFQFAPRAQDVPASSVVLRVDAVKLSNVDVRYLDASTGADWHVGGLEFEAQLPADLAAEDREFRALHLAGQVAGGPIADGGVSFSLRADFLRLTPQQLQVPAFKLQWADSILAGSVAATLGANPAAAIGLGLQAPSLRTLLATVGVTPPPMKDPAALGKLRLGAAVHYAADTATVDELVMALDDTNLTGTVSLPRIEPLALRFDLAADRVDLDRYMEPDDVPGKPFELPLAKLKALDVKGVLRIRQATVAGAAAKEVRIDVE
jgi:AsmA protein